uniref:Uncharacterized protein n=1 Tax=Arundo donax TaxID=35708 RepID=A0A0A9DCJ3_ARUDO
MDGLPPLVPSPPLPVSVVQFFRFLFFLFLSVFVQFMYLPFIYLLINIYHSRDLPYCIPLKEKNQTK